MDGLPSRLLRTSDSLGWMARAEVYRDPPVAHEFSRPPTRDLLVVMVTSGHYRIESRAGRSWRAASFRPGSLGITAPQRRTRLRWRADGPHPMESLHLTLPAGLIADTLEAFGHTPATLPDALGLDDGYVTATAGALAQALRVDAPALYADTLAQSLVTHLVHRSVRAARPVAAVPLDIAQVIDYMHAHLGEELDLDRLAAVATMSKFHFLRSFGAATGLTPHRYLTMLRVRRAADLMRTSDLSVRQVASACGYRSTSRFATAFRREHGVTPGRFRTTL
jgi:AraC family transcriptional regulator